MAHDVDADLVYGGEDLGPEALAKPQDFEEEQRRRRIWIYHLAVIRGLDIRFIPKETVLERPTGIKRRPDPAKEKTIHERIRSVLDLG